MPVPDRLTQRATHCIASAMTDSPLRLFNSLTREMEEFRPIHDGPNGQQARIYSCGPTVYNYQHIGNMRAYIFTDTLSRTLSWKGYDVSHVINITDVGHLTSDADAGDDKIEKAASETGKSARDIAKFYTDAYWHDIERLNIRQPARWSIATDHIGEMLEFAKSIADRHCYELDTGLYFDTSTVPDYGRLARAATNEGESRIDPVEGKRHQTDFAIWRKTPAGETRQMEWDSPWGKGAPGWHLECSAMGRKYLGEQFDIHTGGIDHREIHHPNEIAQNQAHSCSAETGANIWMHNNFLIDRTGKMSKSAGEFLTLQVLVDKGIHPLAYRLMCLQAHYRSELEFTWENLLAARTRLKRIYGRIRRWQFRLHKNIENNDDPGERTINQIEGNAQNHLNQFDQAVSNDLNTPEALVILENVLDEKIAEPRDILCLVRSFENGLGLQMLHQNVGALMVRPANAVIEKADVEALLRKRNAARDEKDYVQADAIRDDLSAKGIEIMDGDELRWEWRIEAG